MNKIGEFFTKLLGRDQAPSRALVAPSYDEGTAETAKWVASMTVSNTEMFIGDQASHSEIIRFLKKSISHLKLIMFVGHGNSGGLFTKPGFGKITSLAAASGHEYLLDSEDLDHKMEGVHIVAWACEAGNYFGQKVGSLRASGFLGFEGPVSMVINHEPSEELWKKAIIQSLIRVGERGYVEGHDAEWLSHLLLDLRNEIKRGTIDTGLHNRVNRMFLKSVAKQARVYLSKEE
jgi:hypothetical protein